MDLKYRKNKSLYSIWAKTYQVDSKEKCFWMVLDFPQKEILEYSWNNCQQNS